MNNDWNTFVREWAVDGMPKDKQRLAQAAFEAGQQCRSARVDDAMVDRFCNAYEKIVPEDCLGLVRQNAIREGMLAALFGGPQSK